MIRTAAVVVAVLIVLFIFLLLFPVTMPLLALSLWLDNRRLCSAAERTACSQCGATLGKAAVDRADAAWTEYFGAAQTGARGK